MKVHTVSFLNAVILIMFSSWGYASSDTPSITAMIPAITGILLLLCNRGIRKENKVVAHIAVLLTFLVLLGLIKPLMGAIERNDNASVFRVVIMLLSSALALFFFIRSFIDARKRKKSVEG